MSPTLEAVVDFESSGGSGLSQTLGLAGFTNADAVRNPELERGALPRAPLVSQSDRAQRRYCGRRAQSALDSDHASSRAGSISTSASSTLVDFFDVNSVASDSHMQFMNWTVVNNGAYDYAADTRGYTWGAVIDYEDRWWGFRFAEALVSKRPNGLTLAKEPARRAFGELRTRVSSELDRKPRHRRSPAGVHEFREHGRLPSGDRSLRARLPIRYPIRDAQVRIRLADGSDSPCLASLPVGMGEPERGQTVRASAITAIDYGGLRPSTARRWLDSGQ